MLQYAEALLCLRATDTVHSCHLSVSLLSLSHVSCDIILLCVQKLDVITMAYSHFVALLLFSNYRTVYSSEYLVTLSILPVTAHYLQQSVFIIFTPTN